MPMTPMNKKCQLLNPHRARVSTPVIHGCGTSGKFINLSVSLAAKWADSLNHVHLLSRLSANKYKILTVINA